MKKENNLMFNIYIYSVLKLRLQNSMAAIHPPFQKL